MKVLILFLTALLGIASGKYATAQSKPELHSVAANHYSAAVVTSFSVEKIVKLNYYYSESFELDISGVNPTLVTNLVGNFDVSKYQAFRERNRDYFIVDESTGLKITLYSWNTVFDRYKIIESMYN